MHEDKCNDEQNLTNSLFALSLYFLSTRRFEPNHPKNGKTITKIPFCQKTISTANSNENHCTIENLTRSSPCLRYPEKKERSSSRGANLRLVPTIAQFPGWLGAGSGGRWMAGKTAASLELDNDATPANVGQLERQLA